MLGLPFLHRVHRNLFRGLGPAEGARLENAYNAVGAAYTEEYYQTEGRYRDFELKTLYLESDLERLIDCAHPYTGCEEFVYLFVETLRSEHIPD